MMLLGKFMMLLGKFMLLSPNAVRGYPHARRRFMWAGLMCLAVLLMACGGQESRASQTPGPASVEEMCQNPGADPRVKAMACPSSDQHWTKADAHTLALTGEIVEGSFDEFSELFTEDITTVIVNSGGGDTYEGVMIGRALAPAEVTVIVDGYCLSSCANYIFAAAERKEIPHGIVGFHGNNRTAILEDGSVARGIRSDAREQCYGGPDDREV